MKKNYLKVPPTIKLKLKNISERYVMAACSRMYSLEEISSGKLNHFGIKVSGSKLLYPESILPPVKSGKFSDRNINGYEVVRKDLSKEVHYNAIEVPNWGDSYNGTHTVYLPYEKYPRDYYGPNLSRMKIKEVKREKEGSKFILIFEIDRILDRQDKEFEKMLLEDLNLLQENIGSCGVQKSGASVSDYIKSINVSWEVMPPGTKDEVVKRIFNKHKPSPEEKAVVEERYDFLMGLKPEKLVFGTSGFERYFGAMLSKNLVVFENVAYGNAIYVMFEDWEKLSQRTRIELLSGRYGSNFERISHSTGWKGRLKKVIAEMQSTTKKKKVVNN